MPVGLWYMKLSIIIESRDKVNYKNINDNEILYLISDNNEVANNYIYEKYKPIVLGIAKKYYGYVRNTIIDFDDVVQSGFFALENAIKQYDSSKNAMFYTFAIHCINNEIMKTVFRTNKKYCLDNTFYYNIYDDYANEFCCNDENKILSRIVYNELKNFSLEMKFEESLVFLLRINGFSYKEISTLLDIKYKKVDYIIQKCKNKLKKTLLV